MKKHIYFTIAGLLLVALNGCRKYVEVDQPGTRVLKYTDDYASLLNNTYYINTAYFAPWLSADDIDVTDPALFTRLTGTNLMIYTWAEDYYGSTTNDADWTRIYKQIYTYNEIIEEIMDSEGGSYSEKKLVMAQARMLRAYSYLDLVNMYGKQYDPATAATDLGVPLMLRPLFDVAHPRASVKAVYDQITEDLNTALPVLPDIAGVNTQASKVATFAILARENLYMSNYEQAAAYADSALKLKSDLLNLADYAGGTQTFPRKINHPEIILDKIIAANSMQFYPLSEPLQALFQTTDLRWQLYTIDGKNNPYVPFQGRQFYRAKLTNEGVYVGPDVPEMLLIKAESLVRTDHIPEGLAAANTLRAHRFLPQDYTPLSATNPADALKLVLQERRREMMGRGTRWFDQKRLNKETALAATVTRTINSETYTLAPNSNRYLYPIGQTTIRLSPEVVQNPR
ncbi:SusD family protein [Chitinophaga costaii]|uniref:SusD family protein n=1 Tax=Chitinophaga costaii TaxID=1335309 RepID=A0A1C4E1K4_9BACT|nr:RagB/SusD family nutrient uptake outer membrane protein [Chitinophaga costaii]PUZ24373.1 RagB/SusD family nutrient uptake outer membrane protein [Chitinophaga costaii]SCC37449.1 SusD family protein [Chitinophaga costaii]